MSEAEGAREVFSREIQCFLGWSRRNVFPPHPNIHTDHDFARERGFEGAIMSASQVVPHLHEALVELLGEETFFGGTRVRYKMVRPVPAEGAARISIRVKASNPRELELWVENGPASAAIVGSALLAEDFEIPGTEQ